MKDRIRQIMESQHMTQQVFADFVGIAPATLSSIFNDRTRPTLNVVEQLKKKIPNLNIDWLMFGSGDMYKSEQPADSLLQAPSNQTQMPQQSIIDFDASPAPTPQMMAQPTQMLSGVKPTPQNPVRDEVKIIDKPQRRVVEIRVFYDDQTWESFAPARK